MMKTQIILSLYDALMFGGRVSRKKFCAANAVSERTFYRYMKEIGLFLMHCKSGYLLKVDEPNGIYYLEKISPHSND